MGALPLVAVVGRPNVGKSTFFNRICGKRISIVEDTPGVTRDRVYGDAEWCGYSFTLIDTGGIECKSTDAMQLHIRKQAELAIEVADVVIFLVDGKEGLTGDDRDACDVLRRSKKPVVLVVNKLDNNEMDKAYEFYELGIGDPYAISAEQALGLGDLLDAVVAHFGGRNEPESSSALKIAVVGKPNAGKSSLVNRLLGYERVIVSDTAGTTRDAIDTEISIDGKDYIIIDTAGIRKKKSIDAETIESYSVMRALGAVKRADIAVLVIDCSEDITEQDVKIAGYIHEQGKPSVIVMNKWDLIEKDERTIEKYKAKLACDLSFMDYFKPLFVSAKSGQRVNKIVSVCEEVFANSSRRITTGALNDLLSDAIAMNEPPVFAGKRLKIYYSTQSSVCPPTFKIFCNNAELMHFSYKRYLENQLRKAADFSGTPIVLDIRSKEAASL